MFSRNLDGIQIGWRYKCKQQLCATSMQEFYPISRSTAYNYSWKISDDDTTTHFPTWIRILDNERGRWIKTLYTQWKWAGKLHESQHYKWLQTMKYNSSWIYCLLVNIVQHRLWCFGHVERPPIFKSWRKERQRKTATQLDKWYQQGHNKTWSKH